MISSAQRKPEQTIATDKILEFATARPSRKMEAIASWAAASANQRKPVLKLKIGRSPSPPDPVPLSKPQDLGPPTKTRKPPPKPAQAAVPVSAATLEMQVTLAERFPACFRPQGQLRLPLKVGIDLDILNLAPDLSETDVKQAIKSYVAAPEYYLASIEGAIRVDLEGNAAGVVTLDQARWAQIKLGKYKPR